MEPPAHTGSATLALFRKCSRIVRGLFQVTFRLLSSGFGFLSRAVQVSVPARQQGTPRNANFSEANQRKRIIMLLFPGRFRRSVRTPRYLGKSYRPPIVITLP